MLRRLITFFILGFTATTTSAAVYVTESTRTASQHYSNNIETGYSDVEIHYKAYFTGETWSVFNIGAGMETACPSSYRRYNQGDNDTSSSGIQIEVHIDVLFDQSGWDSWSPNTVYNCDFKYKMAWNAGGAWALNGTGVSWSNGSAPAGQTINTSHGYNMFKPDCEVLQTCTPIVVDLNNDGFKFTSLEEGVVFDIDGDGWLESTAWTRQYSDDSFLFLDLDEDRLVSAPELFGNHISLLSGSYAIDGFNELQELDYEIYGGNSDGIIDKRDEYFDQLWLWNDANHNAISEDSEVISLKDVNIELISLELQLIDNSDDNGNRI